MHTPDLLFPDDYPRWIYCEDGTSKIVDSKEEWIQMSHTHGPMPEYKVPWQHYIDTKDKPMPVTNLLALTEVIVQKAAAEANKLEEAEALAKLPDLSDLPATKPKRKRNAKNSP